ncbi:SagB/ThcOx family dehydrogenase [Methylocystis iwaonis]|uniref:SagB/ThcOx family dehydrogenase n=1 Tax=Methylocystis iwaonis TaxID=2885079 RepID=UPI002E7B9E45|nr:SagB/ThcOx family dehydrogenase [Methylocystis iwaonis]
MNAYSDALPADIRGYHLRTKHAPNRYALGPAFLDWTSQPSPFRRFEGARLIALPLSRGPETPFPGPARDPAPPDAAALGLFLELAFGLSAWKSAEGSTWAVRNNPSSGNLHPTEAYILANALAGLSETAGLYHYAPQEHGLEERARYEAAQAIPDGGFLLALSAIPWRECWKYGERAFRYCQLDAGHAIGAAAQACAGLGWRAHVFAAPSDDEIAALIGLDRADAFHRREEEHPDVLLWIATDGAPPPVINVGALLAEPRTFHGAANRLSEDHDGWPLVDRAVRLCHKAGSTVPEPPPALPAPSIDGPAIGEVVSRRRSVQRMDGVSTLPLETFRLTLAATLPGAEPLMSAFPFAPRLSLVFYIHRVEGLEPGLYLLARDAEMAARLRAACHADFEWAPVDLLGVPLFRLRAGAHEREATKFACLQPIAGKGCFAVAMIADFDRALTEEGAFAYRRLHWEAGLIGQVFYLWATAAGLAGTGIGCFFDDEVHAMLGLPAGETQFQDVYHFTVGGAVEDTRILTLPPYPEERRRP